jgi:hypothetical protein
MTEVVETAMVDLSTDVNVKRGAIEQSLHLIHRVCVLSLPDKCGDIESNYSPTD